MVLMCLILDSSFTVLDSIFWIDWNHMETLWKHTWRRMISKNSFGKQEKSSKRRLSGTAENKKLENHSAEAKTCMIKTRPIVFFEAVCVCACVSVFLFARHKGHVDVSTRSPHFRLWHETCWCCDGFEFDWIQLRSRLKLGSLIHGSICTCTFGNVVKVARKFCFLSLSYDVHAMHQNA